MLWRPTILFCLLGASLLAGAARGRAQQTEPETRVSARVEHYVDDDATTVIRPRVAASLPVGERGELGLSYLVDGVSSASIDVVTRATQPIREVRHEVGIRGVRYFDRGGSVGGSYGYGHEPDYQTHSLSVYGGRDLDEARLLHLSGRLSGSLSQIGAVGDPSFSRNLGVVTASGGLSRIFDPRTLGRLTLELGYANGFQSSAYRTVRLGPYVGTPYTGSDPDAGAWVFSGVTGVALESHPEQRFRARLLAEGVRAFARYASGALSLGAYIDTYRIAAFEASPEIRLEPRAGMLFRVGGRVYLQSRAYFYRSRYVDEQVNASYLSDDKELGRLRSYSLYGAAAFPLGPVRLDLRVEATRYEYPLFSLLPEKHALASQVGIVWTR